MKKLVFAVIMAVMFFVLLNFVYCNLDTATFGYDLTFKFKIPYLLSLQSMPIPVGFIVLMAFSIGMITIAFLEALPSFYKTLEIRSKNKKIRQLERELNLVRQMNKESAYRRAEEDVEENDEPDAGSDEKK